MHCTSRLWEEAWYFHDIINMIFTSCFKSFTSFIYCMCLIALYIEFSYSWVEQSQGKCSFVLFSSLSCGLAFQLAYSYIPCTDASWPASYYDADTGTQDQHPARRWSSWALQSQWWASLHSGGLNYFVFLVFVLLGCCGVCPNIHLSILEAS